MKARLSSAVWGLVGVLVGASVVGVGRTQEAISRERLAQAVTWVESQRQSELAAFNMYPWLPAQLRVTKVLTEGDWVLLRHSIEQPQFALDYLTCEHWSLFPQAGSGGGLLVSVSCDYQPGKALQWQGLSDREKRAEFERISALLYLVLTRSRLKDLPAARTIFKFSFIGGRSGFTGEAVWHNRRVFLTGEPGFAELDAVPPKFVP